MTSLMSVYMQSVEYDAEVLAHYAGQLENHAAFLKDAPYVTSAEAKLDEAERVLVSALARVRKVRAGLRPELMAAS